MVSHESGIYFRVFLFMKTTHKTPFWPQTSIYPPLNPNVWKRQCLLFLPNSLFESQISKSTLYKMFLCGHTDHFGFHHFLTSTRFFVFIKVMFFVETSHFFFRISVKKDKFIGRHMVLFWRYHIYIYIYTYILYILPYS